jgi:hypothetical protein
MDLSEQQAERSRNILGLAQARFQSSACVEVVHHFSNLDVVWSTTRAIWMIGAAQRRCISTSDLGTAARGIRGTGTLGRHADTGEGGISETKFDPSSHHPVGCNCDLMIGANTL